MTTLLLIVLISQILLYQRVEWLVKQFEPQRESVGDEENDEIVTDGGSSVPPRDNKGRFTTKESGGSNILLIILAAITGYLFGLETGIIDPFAGALIAIAVVSFFQSTKG